MVVGRGGGGGEEGGDAEGWWVVLFSFPSIWGTPGWEKADELGYVEDETEKYPKRFLLLGLILFKNILQTLSNDHKDGSSFFPADCPSLTSR